MPDPGVHHPGELKKAMETGEEILEKLGYQLSRLSLDQWQQTLVQIKPSLAGKSVADVMRFEPLTQPHAEVLVPILYGLHLAYGQAGVTLDDGLWQPIALKRISFLLNHFHPKHSPESYGFLGSIYCLYMQDFEFGYELGRLGIQIMEALDLKEINCRVPRVSTAMSDSTGSRYRRHWSPCWKLIRWESRREISSMPVKALS